MSRGITATVDVRTSEPSVVTLLLPGTVQEQAEFLFLLESQLGVDIDIDKTGVGFVVNEEKERLEDRWGK